MDARSRVAVVADPSDDMASWRRRGEGRSAASSIAASLGRPDDPIAIEAFRLLEDVRSALDRDWVAASQSASRLVALLASKLSHDHRPAPARGGLAPWQIRAVRTYIESRLGGPIRVSDLAKSVSLSASHFSRAFKDSCGEHPHNYVMRRRIERAKALMLTTRSGLSEIAFACGLVDQAHLCRCFRRVTGATPGAWRRGHAMAAAIEEPV